MSSKFAKIQARYFRIRSETLSMSQRALIRGADSLRGCLVSLMFILAAFFSACTANPDANEEDLQVLLGLVGLQASFGFDPTTAARYEKITPAAGSFTLDVQGTPRTISFNPSCAGDSPVNQDFRFYVSHGDPAKVIINFMGGGACWDSWNCFAPTHTFMNLGDLVNPSVIPVTFQGLFLRNREENPFANWTFVLVPYCTGDVHWGSGENTYTLDSRQWNPDPGATPGTESGKGGQFTLRHRGYDNFMAVLDYLQKQYAPGSVDDIFVTGQSAGGYGSALHYPYIKEAYKPARVTLLSDASDGIYPPEFSEPAFEKWGVVKLDGGGSITETTWPDWLSGPGNGAGNLDPADIYDGTLVFSEYYEALANTYTNDRQARYTNAYDGNQRYFFDVMLRIATAGETGTFSEPFDAGNGGIPQWYSERSYNSDQRALFGSGNGSRVPDDLSCYWRDRMRSELQSAKTQIAAGSDNFQYFIAHGSRHTVTITDERDLVFSYTLAEGQGKNLVEWISELKDPTASPGSHDCINESAGCNPPLTWQVNKNTGESAAMQAVLNCP